VEEKKGLELMISRGFMALLSVPLVIEDEGYGGITLYYRKPGSSRRRRSSWL